MNHLPVETGASLLTPTSNATHMLAEIVPSDPTAMLLGGVEKRHKCDQCDFSTDATAYLTIHVSLESLLINIIFIVFFHVHIGF